MINAYFYDIESLSNLFTLANFHDAEKPEDQEITIYFLCDDKDKLLCEPNWPEKATQRIYERNKNFRGKVIFKDLSYEAAVVDMSKTFGVSDAQYINDPSAANSYFHEEIKDGKTIHVSFRITCDTDPDYDPAKHPYFFGYNSYNYDTTMLAHFFDQAWDTFGQRIIEGQTEPVSHCKLKRNDNGSFAVTAKEMRDFNNELFLPEFKGQMPSRLARGIGFQPDYTANGWKIRKNMLMSGRHLDVARLNEKQSKVGLKRLLGMLGYQILESDKLDTGSDTIETPDQFYDLVAYNISDVVNLKQLFYHPQYQGQFELKKGLLSTYPELIYQSVKDGYKPNISPASVRSDRLTIDCSSAQFSTKSLCPYGHLTDIPVVSFNYPTQAQAKLMGVQQVNVLEEAKKFFYGLYPQPELRAEFDRIYDYYKNIEGQNFNDSKYYEEDHKKYKTGNGGRVDESAPPVQKIAEIPKANTCLLYYDKDGKPTSCFVLFGIGGIHGAEYNRALYEADLADWEAAMADMNEAKRQFPNPVDLRKTKSVIMPDGRELKYDVFLKGGRRIDASEYKDLEAKKPQLFRANKKGSYELNKRYVYTSACQANHEDFTSYYPNLLRRMEAFFNVGLGYDRYAEIFQQKQDYGFLMKKKNAKMTPETAEKYKHLRPTNMELDPMVISDEERDQYRVLREGTKLILNSASGAADATFLNNIRVNNQIISMRIIGQLFSWRIGQAQSYAGANIPSTNTDGLYSVMEAILNNQILERESASIGVDIEPEPLFLISKDTNNRIELNADTGEILSASGGTTGCRKGPTPTKALAHPAIIDWALTEYLIAITTGEQGNKLDQPFDKDLGMNILRRALTEFDSVKALIMYQNIIASSSGSITFIYGMKDDDQNPIILQTYNRMFIMKDKTPGTMHLWAAAARAITPAMKKKRQAEGNTRITAAPDRNALYVLHANGEKGQYSDKDIVTKKVTNIDPEWYIAICNKDLHSIDESERQFLIDNLDMEKYLQLLDNAYTRNWMNHVPGVEYNEEDEEESEDMTD